MRASWPSCRATRPPTGPRARAATQTVAQVIPAGAHETHRLARLIERPLAPIIVRRLRPKAAWPGKHELLRVRPTRSHPPLQQVFPQRSQQPRRAVLASSCPSLRRVIPRARSGASGRGRHPIAAQAPPAVVGPRTRARTRRPHLSGNSPGVALQSSPEPEAALRGAAAAAPCAPIGPDSAPGARFPARAGECCREGRTDASEPHGRRPRLGNLPANAQ
jgi:hypothetical protein